MAAENTSSTPPYSGNALGVSPALASEIGGRLKSARASSGKSTRQIADTIKVREQYLSAIEDGRWDDLPRGLNGRGIVRNYARELLVPIPELEPSEIRNHMNSQVHPFEVSSVAAVTPAQHTTSNQRYARPPQPQRTIPRRPVEVAQPVARSVPGPQHIKPNRSAFSDADDDTPLGIVTPDVARILGLPTDTPAVNTSRESEKHSNEAPRVDAKEVISELLKSDVETGMQQSTYKESKKEAKLRDRQKRRVEAEARRMELEHQRQQQQRHDQAELHQAQIQQAASSIQHAQAAVVVVGDSQPSYASQVTEHHATSHPTGESLHVTNDVRAIPDPSIPTLLVQDHQKEVASHQNRGQQIMFVAAAAVLIAATGAYFFIRQDQRVMETDEPSQAAAAVPLQMETTVTTPTETNVEPSVATDAAAQSEFLGMATDAAANTSATNSTVTATENTTTAAAPSEAPASAINSTTTTAPSLAAPSVVATAAVVSTSTLPTGAERSATLKLTGDVEMRIIIDDKVFFSGRKTAGEMPIKFKDKAEILVRDGSKVSLMYEGWDHGVLGHEGRRRRIVLNAQSAD